MDDEEAPYCKVYIRGADDAALKALIVQLTGGSAQRRHIAAPPLDIDVFDQSRHVPADAGDDFVRWPAYLEIGSTAADVSFNAFVAALALLLDGLRARGLGVVPSCSFEAELEEAMRAR